MAQERAEEKEGMMSPKDEEPSDMDRFRAKYLQRLNNELEGASARREGQGTRSNPGSGTADIDVTSREYNEFRKEYLPRHMSLYEKAARLAGKILKVSPGKGRKADDLAEAIETTHLSITPTDAASLALFAPLLFIVIASALGFVLPSLISPKATGGSMFMVIFSAITGIVMIYPLKKLPFFLANSWRMKASNQMVLCIFYMVTYMRHTSNMERAVEFAAEHLSPPLSLDLRKVLWDVETGKRESLKDSIDRYLRTWEKWNKEFIESMHLVESSLYENSETRRLNSLDKALSVMLDETYERMLHYAHNLKGPIEALHMLGIVLPILGLVILPLMVSFIPEVDWYHIMIIYNIALPIGVYYLGRGILSKRPTGYGETQIDEREASLKKYRNVIIRLGKSEMKINPAWAAGAVFIVLFFIGISPILIHATAPGNDWALFSDAGLSPISGYQAEGARFYFLGYRPLILEGEIIDGVFIGPFGLGASLVSILIPLAFGLGLGIFYRLRSRHLVKIRKEARKLEEEFASALFQLGNRLGDGLPAEVAFERVAGVMEDTVSGKFFKLVALNISRLGMGIEDAIFDPHKGALSYYPSSLIESSMKVLVQASKKGPLVASQALINVSEYLKEMHRVDERLKDLMADIVSDMKSQVAFLTPAIAGIVVGITSMITKILGSLGENITSLASNSAAGAGFGAGLLNLFGTGLPTYWFQIIVGVYVVQIVFILTILINGIENGADKLMEKDLMGKYLVKTTVTYCIIAFVVMLLFNIIAGSIAMPTVAGA